MLEKIKTFIINNYFTVGLVILFLTVFVLCHRGNSVNQPTISNITTELNNASAGVDNITTTSKQVEKATDTAIERIGTARQRTETIRTTVTNSQTELDEMSERIRKCQTLVDSNLNTLERVRTKNQ